MESKMDMFQEEGYEMQDGNENRGLAEVPRFEFDWSLFASSDLSNHEDFLNNNSEYAPDDNWLVPPDWLDPNQVSFPQQLFNLERITYTNTLNSFSDFDQHPDSVWIGPIVSASESSVPGTELSRSLSYMTRSRGSLKSSNASYSPTSALSPDLEVLVNTRSMISQLSPYFSSTGIIDVLPSNNLSQAQQLTLSPDMNQIPKEKPTTRDSPRPETYPCTHPPCTAALPKRHLLKYVYALVPLPPLYLLFSSPS